MNESLETKTSNRQNSTGASSARKKDPSETEKILEMEKTI